MTISKGVVVAEQVDQTGYVCGCAYRQEEDRTSGGWGGGGACRSGRTAAPTACECMRYVYVQTTGRATSAALAQLGLQCQAVNSVSLLYTHAVLRAACWPGPGTRGVHACMHHAAFMHALPHLIRL